MRSVESGFSELPLWRRIAGILLIVALSGTFFFSGWSKIHSDNAFNSFHWTFLDIGLPGLGFTGILARIMIGFEFFLGFLLISHVYLKSFTYKAVMGLLLIFIAYLAYLLIKEGDKGNCGCFGDKLAMKPSEALIKNIVMLAVTAFLYYFYPVKAYKFQDFVCMGVGMLSFASPFVLNPLTDSTAPVVNKRPINLDLLYKYSPTPAVDLRKGKQIIAFMSLTCPHCKKAAYLLHIIHKQHPDYPLYMVLDGAPEHKNAFFSETHAEDVPYLLYRHTEEFVDMAGSGVPSIYWFKDGQAVLKSEYAYYQLDPSYMGKWLKQ